VSNGRVHIKPIGSGLLSRDDQIDVVVAAQAMIDDRKEAVGVGRQIDPNDFGFLVGDVIDEAGILVGETVVILTPDVGGKEIVERSDGFAPGNGAGSLQPFGVLIEHGIDDVNERFVAGEKPWRPVRR